MVDFSNLTALGTAATQVYKHREGLLGAWDALRARVWRRRDVAIMGIPGVGKTVLVDQMSSPASGYGLPGTSIRTEKKRIRVNGRTVVFHTPPGQDSPNQHTGRAKLMKSGVDGVIHVVAFGFSDIRSAAAKQALIAQGQSDLAEFRKLQLQAELEALHETCDFISACHRQGKKRPKWLIVAATKFDLYAGELGEANRHYAPEGSSPFVEKLNRLEGHLGRNNFTWHTHQVCAYPQDFVWNGTTVKTKFSVAERDELLGRLLFQIGQHCD